MTAQPTQAPARQQANLRLGMRLLAFALAVFAVTLWKFRPF